MTIKTQGGKVITKGGKVSCECCEPDCCMYPAQALVDGLYTAAGLPDNVTVDGTSFSRSGTGYGNTTNGVILEGSVWAKYRNGVRSTRACLIQGGVVDQFADTYTVEFFGTPPDGPFIGTATATRVSLCRWEFTAIANTCGEGGLGYLVYENFFTGGGARFWRIGIGEQCDGAKDPIDNTTPLGGYGSADGEWRVV